MTKARENNRHYACVIVGDTAYIVQYGKTTGDNLSKGMQNLKDLINEVGKDNCKQCEVGAPDPETAFEMVKADFSEVTKRGYFRGGARGSAIEAGVKSVDLF